MCKLTQMQRMILRINDFPISCRLNCGQAIGSGNRRLVVRIALRHGVNGRHNGNQGYEKLKFHSNTISFPNARYATRSPSTADFCRAEQHVMWSAQLERREVQIEFGFQLFAIPGVRPKKLFVVVSGLIPASQ